MKVIQITRKNETTDEAAGDQLKPEGLEYVLWLAVPDHLYLEPVVYRDQTDPDNPVETETEFEIQDTPYNENVSGIDFIIREK